jgi:hypothetical protein
MTQHNPSYTQIDLAALEGKLQGDSADLSYEWYAQFVLLIQRLRETEADRLQARLADERIAQLELVWHVAQAVERFDREQGLLDTFTGSWAVHPPILDQAEALFVKLRAALAALEAG